MIAVMCEKSAGAASRRVELLIGRRVAARLAGLRRVGRRGTPEDEAGAIPNLEAVEWPLALRRQRVRPRDGIFVGKSEGQYLDARDSPSFNGLSELGRPRKGKLGRHG